jgi:hypothetical protein
MPGTEPIRVAYLFGAGATHAELHNLNPYLDPNGKKRKEERCMKQANEVFRRELASNLLPFGETFFGDSSLPTVAFGALAIGRDYAIDRAAKSSAFLHAMRKKTGVPKSIISRALKFFGKAVTAYTFGDAAIAGQKEFELCMKE